MAADVLRFQHYEVARRPDGSLHELGAGAMGVTYKAFDTNLRVPVALKVINTAYLGDATARQRFLREARTAAALRHPNVAAIYHLGQAGDDAYFYAMELIEGETFHDLVRREKKLEPRFALELALQVARALAAAHERGLIHRDIKPSNLMLYRQHGEPLVKVIDFGLAKVIQPANGGEALSLDGGDDEAPALTQTRAGVFVGTPHYASPEQLEGLSVDTRSDIYSLGSTLWFMLTGRPPFGGTTLMRIVTQHLCREPPFEQLADVPEPLRRLLGRMLEKDPAGRPQNPLALRDEILAALRAWPEQAVPLTGPNEGNPAHPSPPSSLSTTSPATNGNPKSAPAAALDDAAAAADDEDPGDATATLADSSASAPLLVGDFRPGALFGGGRYALGEAIDENAIVGTDTATGQPVTVRRLPPPAEAESGQRRTAEVVETLRAAPAHPHLLRPLDFLPAATALEPGYLVLAGHQRDTLLGLLSRHFGVLGLRDAVAVLEPAAEAIEALEALGLTNPDLRLESIFLPDAIEPDVAESAAGLKLGPTEFFPTTPATLGRGESTVTESGTHFLELAGGSGGSALGWLAYELLGGSPRQVATGRYVPLPALDEAGNALLRRCCTGGPELGMRPRDFVAALRPSGALVTTTSVARNGVAVPTADAAQATDDLTPIAQPPSGRRVRPRRAWSVVTFILFVVLVDVGAFVAWYGWKHYQPTPRVASSLPSSARPISSPAVVVAETTPSAATPFRPDAPWENSLKMKFVPVPPATPTAPAATDAAIGNKAPLLASVWPTRVGDFAAFVRATRYDATGGMFTFGADGRRRQDARRNWEEPGFGQGPTHPVIGVNFDDANAFCAWLTQREHDAGILPASHRYRLPTDTEWSQLAGLREETDDLPPETRGLRAETPDVFPWGDAWPPPSAAPAAGNYAGAELAELPPADRLENHRDDFPRTAPVGSFPTNALGLYDLGGNVWQWCSDRYKIGSDWRTVRGGSWLSGARAQVRLGARGGYAPAFRHDDIGFRVVLAAQP